MQKKKGVSLIVLIITIIVMLILAGTVIISLSNNGIIDKAKDGVDKTNEKEVQELASMAWAEAYANNMGLPKEELQVKLQEGVEKALSDNNLDKEDYGMQVTTTGVTIVKGWLQTKDRTVVKGNTVLNIGDYVNYVSGVSGYTDTNGWQVLGAENGELLVMSSKKC